METAEREEDPGPQRPAISRRQMLGRSVATGAALVWVAPAVEAIHASPAFGAGLSPLGAGTQGAAPRDGFDYNALVACCVLDLKVPRYWTFTAFSGAGGTNVDCDATSYPTPPSGLTQPIYFPVSATAESCMPAPGGLTLDGGPDVSVWVPAAGGLALALACGSSGGSARYLLYFSALNMADGASIMFPPLGAPPAGDQPASPGTVMSLSSTGQLYAAVTRQAGTVFTTTFEPVNPPPRPPL
ncbi:MAG: hypothetical protein ACRDYD_02735 [Acidimicrobiales bacterium]